MDFTPRVDFLKATLANVKDRYVEDAIRWKDDDRSVTLPLHSLDKKFVDALYDIVEAWPSNTKVDEDAKYRCNYRIRSFRKIMSDPSKIIPKKLEALVEALVAIIKDTEHKYVFIESKDSMMIPFYVEKIEFVRGKRDGDVSHVLVCLKAIGRGYKQNHEIRFYKDSLNQPTNHVLALRNIFVETPELFEDYTNELQRYNQYLKMEGEQVAATGIAYHPNRLGEDRYSSSSFVSGSYGDASKIFSMQHDNRPAKLVVDDTQGRKTGQDNATQASCLFWTNRKSFVKGLSDDDGEGSDLIDDNDDSDNNQNKLLSSRESISVPELPYIRCFNLRTHDFVLIHVNNLSEYEWKMVDDKLILPNNHKSLINTLMVSAGELMEDIVTGKTGGIIILATGAPGLGKTLSAEVYSELIKRPLYSIQCTQLGINIDDIEKNLQEVLDRAQRWQAILLIDEADVYIRKRGSDITQNAIVGVFLRLLEYYRGVLFMTSNMETVIDDAILSRSTAHLRYQLPGAQFLPQIWRVLSNQFSVKMSDALIDELVTTYPNLTGRDVKNVLKLTKIMAGSGDVTILMIATAISYQDVNMDTV